jgi:uncharacterized protein (UPF0333 family)
VFDLLAVIISIMFMAYPDFFNQFRNEISYSLLFDGDDRNTSTIVTAGHANTTAWSTNCAGNCTFSAVEVIVLYLALGPAGVFLSSHMLNKFDFRIYCQYLKTLIK